MKSIYKGAWMLKTNYHRRYFCWWKNMRIINILLLFSSIVNLLQASVMRLRCQSRDDDLGYHNMSVHQEFEWRFGNIPYRTLFFCHIWWRNKDVRFDAFNQDIRSYCSDNACFWSVRSDGIHFYDVGEHGYRKVYKEPQLHIECIQTLHFLLFIFHLHLTPYFLLFARS